MRPLTKVYSSLSAAALCAVLLTAATDADTAPIVAGNCVGTMDFGPGTDEDSFTWDLKAWCDTDGTLWTLEAWLTASGSGIRCSGADRGGGWFQSGDGTRIEIFNIEWTSANSVFAVSGDHDNAVADGQDHGDISAVLYVGNGSAGPLSYCGAEQPTYWNVNGVATLT